MDKQGRTAECQQHVCPESEVECSRWAHTARQWPGGGEGSEGEGEESRGSPAHPAQVLGETQGGSLACPSGWLSAHRAGVAGQPGPRPRPWEQVPGASRPGLGGALAASPPHPQGPYRGLALGQDPSASPPVWPRPSQGIQWDPSIGAFSSQGFSYTQEGTWERDTGVDRPGPLPAVPQGARCQGLGSAVPRSPEHVSPRRPCHAPSADGGV